MVWPSSSSSRTVWPASKRRKPSTIPAAHFYSATASKKAAGVENANATIGVVHEQILIGRSLMKIRAFPVTAISKSLSSSRSRHDLRVPIVIDLQRKASVESATNAMRRFSLAYFSNFGRASLVSSSSSKSREARSVAIVQSKTRTRTEACEARYESSDAQERADVTWPTPCEANGAPHFSAESRNSLKSVRITLSPLTRGFGLDGGHRLAQPRLCLRRSDPARRDARIPRAQSPTAPARVSRMKSQAHANKPPPRPWPRASGMRLHPSSPAPAELEQASQPDAPGRAYLRDIR